MKWAKASSAIRAHSGGGSPTFRPNNPDSEKFMKSQQNVLFRKCVNLIECRAALPLFEMRLVRSSLQYVRFEGAVNLCTVFPGRIEAGRKSSLLKRRRATNNGRGLQRPALNCSKA